MPAEARPPASTPARPARLLGELLLRAAAPERRHLAASASVAGAGRGLEALGPLAGKFLIDNYLLPRNARLAAPSPACWPARWWPACSPAGCATCSWRGWPGWRCARCSASASGVRARAALPMAFFDRAITGQLVSRVTNDTEAVKTLYVQVLFVMLDSVIVLTGAMARHAVAGLAADADRAALVPAVIADRRLYQRLSAPAVTRTRALRSELNAQVAESIAGMPVLQAANASPRFERRFAAERGALPLAPRELRANAWLLRPVLDFLNVLLLAV
jgi:ATP-binding cassette subfamily B multidrug efflux pump